MNSFVASGNQYYQLISFFRLKDRISFVAEKRRAGVRVAANKFSTAS